MQKLQKIVRRIFLTIITAAVLSAAFGCKHDTKSSDNENIKQNKITITVKKDVHVKNAIESFKVSKGETLGFTDLKQKISGLEFEKGYELSKICLEQSGGVEITDSAKHKFDKDTAIFIVSKQSSGNVEKAELTKLKIDGVLQPINDIMNFGQMTKEEVEVSWVLEPADAGVKFTPDLKNGKFWVLGKENGKKELKITITKNSFKKEYTVTAKKVPNIKLMKFFVQGAEQEINDTINCGKTKANKVRVDYITYPQDADVKFTPSLETGGIWNLGSEAGSKKLTISIAKDGEKVEYTAIIEKLKETSLSLTKISIDENSKQGNEIISVMDFGTVKKGVVTVKIETSDSNASIAFQNGTPSNQKLFKWFLAGENINTLKIKLTKGSEELIYNIKLKTSAPAVNMSYLVNDISMVHLPNDFNKKARNGSNPLLDLDVNRLNMCLYITGAFNEVYINQKKIGDSNSYDRGFFLHSIKLSEQEIPIEIKITQKEDAYEFASDRILKFRAAGRNKKEKIKPVLKINGNTDFTSDFLNNLGNSSQPPLYKIHNNSAEISIGVNLYDRYFNVKHVEINGETLPFPPPTGEDYLFIEKEINSIKNTEPMPIEVKFVPIDTEQPSSSWYFALQSGGSKPKVHGMKMLRINDVLEKNLPETFKTHLTDNSNPLYEFDGKSAAVTVLANNPKEGTELVNHVVFKIDGEKAKVVPVQNYAAAFAYTLTDTQVHNAEIVFVPNDIQSFSPASFTFRLKRSGKKAKLPENLMDLFINAKTGDALPESIRNHLTDGTAPLYEIDGEILDLYVITEDKWLADKLNNMTITVGKETPVVIPFTLYPDTNPDDPPQWFSGRDDFKLPNTTEPHKVTLLITPKDTEAYEHFTYSFTAKGSKAVPMPLIFGVDGKDIKNGQSIKSNGELASLVVQSNEDLMKSVKIGETGKEKNVQITIFQDADGNPHWQASRIVRLETAAEKTFTIIAEPKNPAEYKTTVWTVSITGSKVLKGNAEFVFAGGQLKFDAKTVFKTGCPNPPIDNYGLLNGIFTFYTVSPRARVKYAFVDADNKVLQNTQEYEAALNAEEGRHVTEKITAFADKPTNIKFWVAAENGSLDPVKGEYVLHLNPVDAAWAYNKPSKEYKDMDMTDFSNKVYDVIKIKKEDIPAHNTIHLIFKGWDPGYKVDKNNKAPEQGIIQEGKRIHLEQKKCYVTTLDVSKLKNKTVDYLEAWISFQIFSLFGSGTEAFTYKVKVQLDE